MAAMFSTSNITPWLSTPSPKKLTDTWSVPRSWAASAAPAASGTLPPTMPVEPMLLVAGSHRCGSPARPQVHPTPAMQQFAQKRLQRRPLGDAMTVAAMVDGDVVVRPKHRNETGRHRLLPRAQVHQAGRLAGDVVAAHGLLENANPNHGPVEVDVLLRSH